MYKLWLFWGTALLAFCLQMGRSSREGESTSWNVPGVTMHEVHESDQSFSLDNALHAWLDVKNNMRLYLHLTKNLA